MQIKETTIIFRSITEDQNISQVQIEKYLKWGNGNMEKALNYYYNRIQKGKQLIKAPDNQAFNLMKKASIKQKKTQTFIANVRKQYQLPIGSQITKNINHQKQISDMDQQFQDADYLPAAFARQSNLSIKQDDLSIKQNNVSIKQQQQKLSENKDKQIFKTNQIKKTQTLQKTDTTPLVQVYKHITSSSINKQQKISNYNLSLNQKFDQKQLYLGELIFKCIATQSKHMNQCQPGTAVGLIPFIQQPSKKKSFKKKQLINLNLRVSHEGRVFGRAQDEEARILVPLINSQLIRIQSQIFDTPMFVTFPNTFKLKTQVFLLKKAITQPIIQTFQGNQDGIIKMYKQVREQLLGLFHRLHLNIITQPLIKGKSIFNKNKKTEIHTQEYKNTQLQHERHQMKQKQLQEEFRRKRVDPNYCMIQKNLFDSFQTVKPSLNNIQSDKKQKSIIQSQKNVEKRVIQFNVKDESKFAQLIDLYHQDLKPAKTSSFFKSQLYNYQALALAWMLRREGENQDQSLQKEDIHPLWTEYQISHSKYRLFFNQLTAQISIKRPISKVRCRGGILADEMGLGKTVMMSALISMSKLESNKKKRTQSCNPTINITLSMGNELNKHTNNLKILQYYSQERHKYEKNLHNYDVVLTTYGTISYQFSKGSHISKTGLFRYKWKRIILDEAHYIKGRIIQTAKAVYELEGDCRWCLTGTPIQNNLSDLFSLIHFIRYTPWADYECWSRYIQKPYENGEQGVMEVLRTLLKRVFLRRTKNSKDHQGKLIVELPKKVSTVQILTMGPKQRQFYDAVYDSSRKKIDQLAELGILQAKYMQVLQILMRLRQICCHPALFKSITKFVKDPKDFQAQVRKFLSKRELERQKQEEKDSKNEQQYYYQPIIQQNEQQIKMVKVNYEQIPQAFLKQTIDKIISNELQHCKICLNDLENPVITTCLHIFCKSCLIRQIQENMSCGYCRRKLSKEDYLHLPRQNRLNIQTDKQFFRSTKMEAIIQILNRMSNDDKIVIFSQFLGMLDLIEFDLNKNKIGYTRMQGSSTQKQRTKAIDSFQNDPSIKVFLVSLKTAGVGLNLVAANKVILVDPWWNPGVQEQAIQRVHRIGQKRQVEIIRLIMDETIEMRMLELNTNKRNLSQAVMAHQQSHESKVETLKYLMQKY